MPIDVKTAKGEEIEAEYGNRKLTDAEKNRVWSDIQKNNPHIKAALANNSPEQVRQALNLQSSEQIKESNKKYIAGLKADTLPQYVDSQIEKGDTPYKILHQLKAAGNPSVIAAIKNHGEKEVAEVLGMPDYRVPKKQNFGTDVIEGGKGAIGGIGEIGAAINDGVQKTAAWGANKLGVITDDQKEQFNKTYGNNAEILVAKNKQRREDYDKDAISLGRNPNAGKLVGGLLPSVATLPLGGGWVSAGRALPKVVGTAATGTVKKAVTKVATKVATAAKNTVREIPQNLKYIASQAGINAGLGAANEAETGGDRLNTALWSGVGGGIGAPLGQVVGAIIKPTRKFNTELLMPVVESSYRKVLTDFGLPQDLLTPENEKVLLTRISDAYLKGTKPDDASVKNAALAVKAGADLPPSVTGKDSNPNAYYAFKKAADSDPELVQLQQENIEKISNAINPESLNVNNASNATKKAVAAASAARQRQTNNLKQKYNLIDQATQQGNTAVSPKIAANAFKSLSDKDKILLHEIKFPSDMRDFFTPEAVERVIEKESQGIIKQTAAEAGALQAARNYTLTKNLDPNEPELIDNITDVPAPRKIEVAEKRLTAAELKNKALAEKAARQEELAANGLTGLERPDTKNLNGMLHFAGIVRAKAKDVDKDTQHALYRYYDNLSQGLNKHLKEIGDTGGAELKKLTEDARAASIEYFNLPKKNRLFRKALSGADGVDIYKIYTQTERKNRKDFLKLLSPKDAKALKFEIEKRSALERKDKLLPYGKSPDVNAYKAQLGKDIKAKIASPKNPKTALEESYANLLGAPTTRRTKLDNEKERAAVAAAGTVASMKGVPYARPTLERGLSMIIKSKGKADVKRELLSLGALPATLDKIDLDYYMLPSGKITREKAAKLIDRAIVRAPAVIIPANGE